MKGFKWALFTIVLALLSTSFATAQADIEYVRINGEIVDELGGNEDDLRVDLGEELDVRVKVTADGQDHENVEVAARIVGHEYRQNERVFDVDGPFDIDDGETEFFDLSLDVPRSADKDTYELRIELDDRTDNLDDVRVTLNVKGPRSDLDIRDVIFSPGGSVQAGRVLLVQARVENLGTRDLDDVLVRAEIPDLNVEGTVFIDEEIDGSESDTDVEVSEEIFLRIPACAEAGVYDVYVTAEYERFEEVTQIEQVRITQGDGCDQQASSEPTQERTVVVPPQAQTVEIGQGGASYPVVITNLGSSAKTYAVSTSGVAGWGIAQVSDPAVVIQPGETKTAYVFVSANEGVEPGQQIFTISVNEKSFTSMANIVEGDSSGFGLMSVLEVGLIILVVILIILGIIVGFSRLRNDSDEEGKTYY